MATSCPAPSHDTSYAAQSSELSLTPLSPKNIEPGRETGLDAGRRNGWGEKSEEGSCACDDRCHEGRSIWLNYAKTSGTKQGTKKGMPARP
jgi:hypothetical protein